MKKERKLYQQPQMAVITVTIPHLLAGTNQEGNSVKDWEDSSSNTEEGTITF